MAERDLTVKTNSQVNGLPALDSINGDLSISVSYDDTTVNVGVEPVELEDPLTSKVEILEERKLKNALEGIECELLINQDADIIYQVDVDGSIYVSDQKSRLDGYEINNNAELTYIWL